jgi:malonate-semialdehyde dehydrogenase (acetylating)/methylmalonate-semialdehyde dehydrogenase
MRTARTCAKIITQEHGKTLADAEGEVTRGIEVIEFAIGIPHLLKGEFSENVGTDVDSFSIRQPLGVCAGITPFNFPAMVPLWMFPVAIACGNTFVLKPSERDPTLSHAHGRAARRRPAARRRVQRRARRQGGGRRALAHPLVRAISFVGSTPIAKYIYETGARHGKRVQALGGAKNHAVVLPDADLAFATEAIIGRGLRLGRRALHGDLGDRRGRRSGDPLVERLAERARSVSVGPGDAANIEMGPVITCAARIASRATSTAAWRRVRARRGRTQSAGRRRRLLRRADAVRPRRAVDGDLPRRDLRAGAVGRARRVAEGCDRAHQRESVRQRHRHLHALGPCRAQVPAGHRSRHGRHQRPDSRCRWRSISFGGWRASLFGDLNVHGMDGVRFYTRGKTITSRWPDDGSAAPGFHMPMLG